MSPSSLHRKWYSDPTPRMEIRSRLHAFRAPGHGSLPHLRVFGEPIFMFPTFFSRNYTECASCHLVLRITSYYDDFHDVRAPFTPLAVLTDELCVKVLDPSLSTTRTRNTILLSAPSLTGNSTCACPTSRFRCLFTRKVSKKPCKSRLYSLTVPIKCRFISSL